MTIVCWSDTGGCFWRPPGVDRNHEQRVQSLFYWELYIRKEFSLNTPVFIHLRKNIICNIYGVRSAWFEPTCVLYIKLTGNASVQELDMQEYKQNCTRLVPITKRPMTRKFHLTHFFVFIKSLYAYVFAHISTPCNKIVIFLFTFSSLK